MTDHDDLVASLVASLSEYVEPEPVERVLEHPDQDEMDARFIVATLEARYGKPLGGMEERKARDGATWWRDEHAHMTESQALTAARMMVDRNPVDAASYALALSSL